MKIEPEAFEYCLSFAVAPHRPDRDEWVEEIERHLAVLGLHPRRRFLVEAWEAFSSSRDAQWLSADKETVGEFAEWVIRRVFKED